MNAFAKWSIAATLALVPLVAMADGTFCVVTNYGRNCFYYDANQCRAAAYQQGGMCVLNEGQPGQSSTLDRMKAIQDGGDRGRQAAYERQGHDAQMALLEAQRAAIQQPQQGVTTQANSEEIALAVEASQGKYRVVYVCNGVRGFVPLIGCTVAGYSDP